MLRSSSSLQVDVHVPKLTLELNIAKKTFNISRRTDSTESTLSKLLMHQLHRAADGCHSVTEELLRVVMSLLCLKQESNAVAT